MKVTAVKGRRGAANRLSVYIDGELAFTIEDDPEVRERWRPGEQVEEAEVEQAIARSQRWSIGEAALRLLAHRPRSRAQLRLRLLGRGYPLELVEECLASEIITRYLDDDEFARSFVRERVRRKPRGPRTLIAELRARGIDPQSAERAVLAVLDEEGRTERDLARQAAERLTPRRGQDPRLFRRRVRLFLARKGFGNEAIRAAIDELASGRQPDGP